VSAFALVHSPLVGASTWRWVAAELSRQGNEVAIIAVRPQRVVEGWPEFVAEAAGQLAAAGPAILVGHSGAGPLLPQIAAAAGGAPLLFVDAGLPPEHGDVELMPAELLTELHGLAIDGVLPPWSDWFGPDVLRELVPDEDKRQIIAAELPRLPVSYFASRVPAPPGWAAAGGGYIQLSGAYSADAAEAARRGWPVIERHGGHLDIVTRPTEIAAAITEVAAAVTARPGGAQESSGQTETASAERAGRPARRRPRPPAG
jgi:hypothetical protein